SSTAPRAPSRTSLPYTTLFRSGRQVTRLARGRERRAHGAQRGVAPAELGFGVRIWIRLGVGLWQRRGPGGIGQGDDRQDDRGCERDRLAPLRLPVGRRSQPELQWPV